MEHQSEQYEAPTVRDYGDLVELTAATGFTGPEDGGSKLLIHHSAPSL
ncbi:MAG: lasso RiPP family leader peptide-containing protein [Solirubrobacterales bacterium]